MQPRGKHMRGRACMPHRHSKMRRCRLQGRHNPPLQEEPHSRRKGRGCPADSCKAAKPYAHMIRPSFQGAEQGTEGERSPIADRRIEAAIEARTPARYREWGPREALAQGEGLTRARDRKPGVRRQFGGGGIARRSSLKQVQIAHPFDLPRIRSSCP